LKNKFLILFILFLISFNSLCQTNSLNSSPPLNIPLIISGTFGELRANHFHAGLDIKTNGKEGYQVKSFNVGYVDRIRISTSGYGKALYIKHPNGLTSVYAHLSKFSSKIESFVKSHQYEKEVFEIQLFPKDNKIKVKAGEIIGFSGNTGGSSGPHLHFEVRDSKNQKTINPLNYLNNIKDDRNPSIRSMYVFKKNDEYPEKISKYEIKKINDSIYRSDKIITSGEISFGLNMFDRQSFSYNRNGIYKASIYQNDSLKFQYTFDELDFEDSKFINLLRDYKTKKEKGITIQRIIKHPDSKKSFLTYKYNNGFFNIKNNKKYFFTLKISDYEGNNSFVEITIIGKNQEKKNLKTKGKLIKTDENYLIKFEDKEIIFKKNTFYDNVYLDIKESNDTLYVDKDIFPLKNPVEISFKINNNDSLLNRQSFISKLNSKGKPLYLPTQKKENRFHFKSNSLGVFFIAKDTISPDIKPINFYKGQWISKLNYLKIKIKDDFSGIKNYKGFLNNKWILFEYEPKTSILTYNFSDIKFNNTKHYLKIYLEDNVGNKKIFKTMFYRKY
tara:strand:- start:2310 stop:3983 length:1674 start_codon:yes stop_codon:yes gene_type:complete